MRRDDSDRAQRADIFRGSFEDGSGAGKEPVPSSATTKGRKGIAEILTAPLNRSKTVDRPPVPDVKKCVECFETIRFEATRCMHCGAYQGHAGVADLGLAMALMPLAAAFGLLGMWIIQPHPDDQQALIMDFVVGIFIPIAILAAIDAFGIARRRRPSELLSQLAAGAGAAILVFFLNGIGLVVYCTHRRIYGAPACAGLAIFSCTLLGCASLVGNISEFGARQDLATLQEMVKLLETWQQGTGLR